MNTTQPEIQTDIDTAINELLKPNNALIMYNDEVNTFDHVIRCLIAYCNHSNIQAEQCALIIHHSGKSDVKHGSYEELKPVCEALLEQGLSVKIE